MSEERLKLLISKRAIIKGQLTKFNTFLENFDPQKTVSELKVRLEKIEASFENYHEIQSEIMYLQDVDPEANTDVDNFETAYFELVGRARELLLNSETSNSAITNTSPISNSSENLIHAQVKLPTLKLPEFRGSYQEWVPFHETFNSLIETNTSLNNIQKFHYLLSCLKGEAAQVIGSLEISDANYGVAWNLLRDRYQNRRMIIHNHVRALFELQPVKTESYTALRKFLDEFQKHLRALSALNQETDKWDTLLIYLLCSKLDTITKTEFEKSIQNQDDPTVKGLCVFLNNRCQLLETVDSGKSNFRIKAHLATQKSNCSFCNRAHYNYQCDILKQMTPAQRMTEIDKQKLCVNCLRPGHGAGNCKFGSCKICHKKHNTLLHSDEPCVNNAGKDASMNAAASSSVISTHCKAISIVQVLLSTAVVFIRDIRGNFVKCRALLDSGSQTHFMTVNLSKQLGLKYSEVDVPITGIGMSQTNALRKVQTTIRSIYDNFSTKLTCLIIDKITDSLPTYSLTSIN